MPRLLRDYSVTNGGDIKVIDYRGGTDENISTSYQNIARDPVHRRVEAIVEVWQEDDGTLSLRHLRNGIDASSKASFELLLELCMFDSLVSTPPPRRL